MIYDAAIIGTGPAGFSAALNLRIHNKTFLWIGSKTFSDKVAKAEKIMNYPGLRAVSGGEMAEAFQRQCEDMSLEIHEAMVNTILPFSGHYALMAGSDFFETRTVILATGVTNVGTLPGEDEKVGQGVSYCATCDGVLYRGKTIGIICSNARFKHEVRYLAELAQTVYYFPTYAEPGMLPENVHIMPSRAVRIFGEEKVSGIACKDGSSVAVDGVFCLRDTVSLNTLLPGLEQEDGHLVVDRRMATNLPGVYAAGDCTGRPYQYAKAVGEGNVAAHSVIASLAALEEAERK